MSLSTEELLQRRAFLVELIEQLKIALACAPTGRLRVSSSFGVPRYYLRAQKTDKGGKYLKRSEIQKAVDIAQRDYNAAALEAAEREVAGIDALLGAWEKGSVEETYEKLILPRKQLVIPAVMSDEEYARIWKEVRYQTKGFKAGSKEIYSVHGHRVRSKSEGNIYDALDDFGVPVRYEAPIKLYNGETIFPDFTLLNVKKRKQYFWEHLGKVDEYGYMDYNIDRVNDLIKSGYIPGDNLILTYEKLDVPIDLNIVKTYINHYLL